MSVLWTADLEWGERVRQARCRWSGAIGRAESGLASTKKSAAGPRYISPQKKGEEERSESQHGTLGKRRRTGNSTGKKGRTHNTGERVNLTTAGQRLEPDDDWGLAVRKRETFGSDSSMDTHIDCACNMSQKKHAPGKAVLLRGL